MERKLDLSVIVPVYRVEAYLPRCIDSILAQQVPDMEVLLVDDGSPDGCGAICDEYASRDSRVQVIHQENGGLSSARNAGLDAARGEFVTFVDSDDYLAPGAYEAMLALAREQGAQLVCGGRYDVDEDTGEITPGLCPEKTELLTGRELVGRIFLWDGCDSSACDKLYRRELFDGIRYPVGRVCEDVPVTYRVVLRAEKVLAWNGRFYHYCHRSGSISQSDFSPKSLHFSQNTQGIYRDIQENWPELEPQAEYLRVWSLTHLLLLLDSADAKTRRTYAQQAKQARQELRRHTCFALRSPYLSRKERLRQLLLEGNLYWLTRLARKK